MPNRMSPGSSPVLTCSSFIILYFTFLSVIHFGLIFVNCLKVCVQIFFFFLSVLACEYPVSTCLLKCCSFSIALPLLSSKISWLNCVSVSGPGILVHGSVCLFGVFWFVLLFLPVPRCLAFWSFIVSLRVGQCQSSDFVHIFLQHRVGFFESFALSQQPQSHFVGNHKITYCAFFFFSFKKKPLCFKCICCIRFF